MLSRTRLGFLALDYFFETPAYSLAIDDISVGVRSALLNNIAAQSEQLAHFIGDALALSRIEAGLSRV